MLLFYIYHKLILIVGGTMNIRQLTIFKEVCKEGNISKAAQSLYMSQPAVTIAIKELEASLTEPLFDRIANRLILNESGKLFLTKTIHLLELYDDLEKNHILHANQVPLRIGSSMTIANFWLPKIIKTFEEHHQITPVHVQINSAKEISEKLLRNELDFALIEGAHVNEQLIHVPFSKYLLSFVCSPSHPLASKKEITFNQLLTYRILLREEGSAIRETFDSLCTLHNEFIAPTWISTNSQSLIQATLENLGITILPIPLIQKELEEGRLIKINVKDIELINTNYIVYFKDKFITSSMKEFIKIIKQFID